MQRLAVIALILTIMLALLVPSTQVAAVSKHLSEPNVEKVRSEMVRLGSASPSTDITVCNSGCQFTTIQAANDDPNTADADVITVMDAVHIEQGINITKSVTIQGSGVNQQTLVEASTTRGAATMGVLAIAVSATVTIRNMTVRYGHASQGGGILNFGSLSIFNSTIAENDADNYGGGILNVGGTLSLTNVTLSGNAAAGSSNSGGGGGALEQFNGGSATIAYSTIANNSAPNVAGIDGIWLISGTLDIRNSIVAGNGSEANCKIDGGTLTPAGENIDGGNTCTGFSKPNTDPKLDTLKDNGGPGLTQALLIGSPAIDAIAPNVCDVTTDERGVSRPQGAGCDIGAFELVTYKVYLPAVLRSYAPASVLPNFSHIFVIVMENKERSQIVNNPDAEYINFLRTGFAEAANYYGIRHPSLPNYLTLTSGHTFGISTDCTDCYQNAENIVSQLEAAGKSWKAYQEDMPSPCFIGDSGTLYRQKHDPFIYYDDVRLNPTRCNKIVPFTEFKTDLDANTLPDFVWITPNMCDDMHDCSIAVGSSWLNSWVPSILNSPAWKNNGVLFIVFDEGTSNAGCCNSDPGGGQVVALVISPLTRPGNFVSSVPYNHYSLLRTIEEAWGLPFLGHAGDASIQSMTDFFQASSASTLAPAGAARK